MNVTVFGASGKVGRLVVDKLLKDGHQVTVFVHSSGSFTESDQLKIVRGDVHDPSTIAAAVQSSDAIISALGSWGTKHKDILSSAVEALIPTMQQQEIKRIITLTGSAARAPGDGVTISNKLMHTLFGLVAKPILQDGEKHLRLLHESKLDWTSLRAGIMKNGDVTDYSLNHKLPGAFETVTRATVARALVDQLDAKDQVRQAPHVHG